MKRALLLLSILFVAVATTACINNFAVQELNSKAQQFMEKGDYISAIERLKSSIDLDDTIFETHYNLAVAYTHADDYINAIDEYKRALELNPEFADSYYSLAVTQENLVTDLKSGSVRIAEDGSLYNIKVSDEEDEEEYIITDDVRDKINNLKNEAISNYELYLTKKPDSDDADEINTKIRELHNVDVLKD